MGAVLSLEDERIVIKEASVLGDYKNATLEDYHSARENFESLRESEGGDKMTLNMEEFDEVFSLICQDPNDHFKLFDTWLVGKVDALEVLAVTIVFSKSTIEAKLPLLFNLFDFDGSNEISHSELVMLMICTSRGLCKMVGLVRPETFMLELLAQEAFEMIDRDKSGMISFKEFSDWALKEPSIIKYLKTFATTRLIYNNQLQYDTLMKKACDAFIQFSIVPPWQQQQPLQTNNKETDKSSSFTCNKQPVDDERGGQTQGQGQGQEEMTIVSSRGSTRILPIVIGTEQSTNKLLHYERRELLCTLGTIKEIIKRLCEQISDQEVEYLVDAMRKATFRPFKLGPSFSSQHQYEDTYHLTRGTTNPTTNPTNNTTNPTTNSMTGRGSFETIALVPMHSFCLILSSYLAFLVADEDHQLLVDLKELKILLWLQRGKEPLQATVDSFMKSLDADKNGVLSPMEWVSYAIESDERTGTLSFTSQVHVLFASSDQDGDARLSKNELQQGLTMIIMQLLRTGLTPNQWKKMNQDKHTMVDALLQNLTTDLMQLLDLDQNHRIEWYEFRQHLDLIEDRIKRMKEYIMEFVLK